MTSTPADVVKAAAEEDSKTAVEVTMAFDVVGWASTCTALFCAACSIDEDNYPFATPVKQLLSCWPLSQVMMRNFANLTASSVRPGDQKPLLVGCGGKFTTSEHRFRLGKTKA